MLLSLPHWCFILQKFNQNSVYNIVKIIILKICQRQKCLLWCVIPTPIKVNYESPFPAIFHKMTFLSNFKQLFTPIFHPLKIHDCFSNHQPSRICLVLSGCWQWQASVLHLSAQLFIALRTVKPALEIQVENFRILNWKFL